MKSSVKKSNKKAAFTIVELLTIMSIIVILMGLLMPSLNKVRRYARTVKQRAQFHSIDVALDLYSAIHEGYPDSSNDDEENNGVGDGDYYCGAMKLCEAMMGQDLLGFHPDSLFNSDYEDGGGNLLYDDPTDAVEPDEDNLRSRQGPYLELENANANRLRQLQLFGANFGSYDEYTFVLCDVYKSTRHTLTGGRVGLPILYYRANTSGIRHDPNDYATQGDTDYEDDIYHYDDNYDLLAIMDGNHPLYTEREKFYEMTKNDSISISSGRPYRVDSYILISAGFDGLYGTRDDVFNFAN